MWFSSPLCYSCAGVECDRKTYACLSDRPWLGKMISVAFSKWTGRGKVRRDLVSLQREKKLLSWPKRAEREATEVAGTESFYPENIESIRRREFPLLQGCLT